MSSYSSLEWQETREHLRRCDVHKQTTIESSLKTVLFDEARLSKEVSGVVKKELPSHHSEEDTRQHAYTDSPRTVVVHGVNLVESS